LNNGKRTGLNARNGFTLLEMSIAMSVLAVALLAYSQSVMASMKAAAGQRELDLATAAAHQTISEIQASPFDQIFSLYNLDDADDPGGAGTAPGPFVNVSLDPVVGAPGGMVGQVILPVRSAGGVEQLREDVNDPALGCPRDLNGDQVVDALDHQADYQIIPVVVRMRWVGHAGDATIEFRTSLVNL